MEWICWILPACISMKISNKRNKKENTNVNIISELCTWASWVIGINVLTLVVIMYVLGVKNIMVDAYASLSFALKYLLIAAVFAIILPYVIEVFRKYINVSVDIERIDK